MPVIEISYVAIGLAAAAHFFIGFLWYTPLFGKVWAKEMGFKMEGPPPSGVMVRGMTLGLIGNILLAWVLAHNMAAWNPESWGQAPAEVSAAANAGMAAVFTWLGFFVPADLNVVAWEGKSWKLFAINTGYHLVSLLAVATILAYLG